MEEERPIGDGSEEGQGTRGRSTSRTERFATPASWRQSTGLGPRTSGAMPEEVPDQGHGKTEGLLPGGPAFRLVQDQVEMDLQRMLEREVVQKLHEENLALKQQVAGMMKERGKGQGSNMESSSWSEVTATDGKDIRMDTPRRLSGDGGRGVQDRRRYTRGVLKCHWVLLHPGDRCPPVPPWPWEHYDHEQQREMVKAWLGPVSPRVGLHDHSPGGGTRSRQGQGGRGMESRHELYQGGIESRQEQGPSDGSFLSPEGEGVLTASEARTAWLERELSALRGKMEAMQKVEWNAEYWGNPVGARKGSGGDRASHGSHVLPGGDRVTSAWKLTHLRKRKQFQHD